MNSTPNTQHSTLAVGVLGGTFDPIHYGHLRTALDVQRLLGISDLRLVPAFRPPHREPPRASAVHRLAMLRLALEEFSSLSLDEREYRRDAPSYTVDTLQSFRVEFPSRPLCLLLGLDSFLSLETWHRWQSIPDACHFVVMTRPGFELADASHCPWAVPRITKEKTALRSSVSGKIYFAAVTPQPISATDVRARRQRGEPIEGLVPKAVADYIDQHHLYRT